jgi:phytoene/squalene synthetase
MKALFDQVSHQTSKLVTESYSTSFSLATRIISNEIRQDIYNIYGFVRFADEIVDTFHDYNKAKLFTRFEQSLEQALTDRISLNPILNSFQETVHRYNIDREYITAFMQSMHWDLSKKTYLTDEEYKAYIYGSADVVGLMCLKVFVKGDDAQFDALKDAAMRLGSAFQKVNFLRDLKADHEHLERSYFPNVDMNAFDEHSKQTIIEEIEADFSAGLKGIFQLPDEAKFGVYTAYKYYLRLLKKLKKTPSTQIKAKRIRVPNYQKVDVLARSFIRYQFNLL